MIGKNLRLLKRRLGSMKSTHAREVASMCKWPVVEKSIAYEKISERPNQEQAPSPSMPLI